MKNLLKLNSYLLKYKYSFLVGFFFIAAANFLSIFAIKYFSNAINEMKTIILTEENEEATMHLLFINAGIFIVLNILSGVFRYFQRQTIIVSSRKIEYDLKNKIFQKYTFLPNSFYKMNKIGDLMNRVSEDASNVRMYLGPGIMYIVNIITLFTIIFSFMISYDVVLTFVSLIPLPILSFLIYKVSSTINRKAKKKQFHQSAVSSFVQDSFSGIRIIKSYAKENYAQEEYETQTENYKQASLSLAKTEAFFFPLMTLIIGLANIMLLYFGGLRYFNGYVDIGTIASFFLYINHLIWPFISLGWVTSLIQRAEVSMARINEFMVQDVETIPDTIDSNMISGDIIFDNVSYTYPNTGVKALANISFQIKENETLAIFGKTGTGKSTIAMLLTGLIKPDSGSISIDGKPYDTSSLAEIRNSIGYVPQDSFLFSDTIINNLTFGVDEIPKDLVEYYAKKADIHKNILGFANQYETKIGERGVTLSGGQKQRISIARALIKNTPILIFDDALSAVDTETEEVILKNIQEDVKKKTTIIISHRVSSAKNADQILVLNEEGNIAESADLNTLLDKKGEFYSLYQKQLLEKDLPS